MSYASGIAYRVLFREEEPVLGGLRMLPQRSMLLLLLADGVPDCLLGRRHRWNLLAFFFEA